MFFFRSLFFNLLQSDFDSCSSLGLDSSIYSHLRRNWSCVSMSGFKRSDKNSKLSKPPFCMELFRDSTRLVFVAYAVNHPYD